MLKPFAWALCGVVLNYQTVAMNSFKESFLEFLELYSNPFLPSLFYLTIVNRCKAGYETRQVSLFHVFVPFLALTLHKTRQKQAFFRQDNQSKASTNLFEINLRTKNKRLCRVTVGSTSNCDCIVPAFEIPRVS